MSNKHTEDKKKEGYPWTARQKRQVAGSRGTRKQATGVMLRNKQKASK